MLFIHVLKPITNFHKYFFPKKSNLYELRYLKLLKIFFICLFLLNFFQMLYDMGCRVLSYPLTPNFNHLSENNLWNSGLFLRWIFSLQILHVSYTKLFYVLGFIAELFILFHLTVVAFIQITINYCYLKMLFYWQMNFVCQHNCLFFFLIILATYSFIHSTNTYLAVLFALFCFRLLLLIYSFYNIIAFIVLLQKYIFTGDILENTKYAN